MRNGSAPISSPNDGLTDATIPECSLELPNDANTIQFAAAVPDLSDTITNG